MSRKPWFSKKGESEGFDFIESQMTVVVIATAFFGLMILAGKLGWI